MSFPAPTLALLALTVVLALLAGAHAHATMNPATASANAYTVTALRVPHGCSGAATNAVTVQIPDDVYTVKPAMTPGWAVSIDNKTLTPPAVVGGTTYTWKIASVTWTAGPGNALPDWQYYDFGIQWKTPAADAGKVFYFPAVQKCEGDKTAEWTQVPKGADDKTAYEHPAPTVKIVESASSAGSASNGTAAASKSGAVRNGEGAGKLVVGAVGALAAAMALVL
ncbi:nuclear export factor GLE1 [Allomyces macrogynus ATCC 38327]|uniref:Nuclear export factor GLE1 n=1 Tax=Allomyces macrogynus (strain ATCC 38327) TaxID=578462 RepID=A0A0L0TDV2_ALLM3|nr:nuclear export factor GLE1 [Allomyces macrogynus ATCC 38327]|eukprot:KNE72917.1 nuclear export factor GLE1 [Allomyces macrogynus ATCC 38327]